MNGIKTIRNISKTYRHITRYRQIFHILMKNGFGFVFRDLKLYKPDNIPIFNHDLEKWNASAEHLVAERFRNTLVELGPTFVKLGQFLSCRPDILSAELIASLTLLRENVPPFPFDEVKQIIKQELKHEINELFADFSDKPAGSASIAQGYRATLKDGTKVFVKVQRPNIQSKINIDLEILSYLALHLEENIPELAIFHPTKLVEDFAASLLKELDFHNEAANMAAFKRQFQHEENIVIPKPYTTLSTSKVLTMSYISGIHPESAEQLKQANIDANAVGELGVKLLLEQFFDYGFFHGDPHPGNMFVLPGPKISYIDFGVVERLTTYERNAIKKLAMQMYVDDFHGMAKTVLTMVDSPDSVDSDGLERDLTSIVTSHLRGNVEDLDMSSFIRDFYQVCYHRKLSLHPHFYSMLRALSYADAMGRSIAPDFNICTHLRPFMLKQSLERLNLLKHLKKGYDMYEEWLELAKVFPENSVSILRQLQNGTLKLNHRLDYLQDFSNILNNALRSVVAGMIVSATIIASSLICLAKLPPLVYGISLLGLCTFVISAAIGLIMLIKNEK